MTISRLCRLSAGDPPALEDLERRLVDEPALTP